MGTVPVVKPEVGPEAPYGISEAVVLFETHLLVFRRTPQTFDEDVVEGSTSTVRGDRDARSLQDIREARVREPGTLIGVEYLRLRKAQRLPKRLNAKLRLQGNGDRPTHHVPAEPVENRHEVDKAVSHANIRDVARSHLARAINRESPRTKLWKWDSSIRRFPRKTCWRRHGQWHGSLPKRMREISGVSSCCYAARWPRPYEIGKQHQFKSLWTSGIPLRLGVGCRRSKSMIEQEELFPLIFANREPIVTSFC